MATPPFFLTSAKPSITFMCAMKIWERVVEASLKREVTISEQ